MTWQRARRRRARKEDPVLGDERDELAEGRLDGLLVLEDVGVIELDRRDERRARLVVQELGALVEEGRVVLVALDDHLGALPEPPRLAEVQRHAPDQERRVAARVVEDVRQDRRRRRLAMGSRDDDRVLPLEEEAPEQRREGLERDVALVGGEDLDVVLAADVADDDDVGGPVEVRGAEALERRHAQLRELRRHGRVHVLVGAAHVVPRRLEQPRERPHARPGNPNQMHFHRIWNPGRVPNLLYPGLRWAKPACGLLIDAFTWAGTPWSRV